MSQACAAVLRLLYNDLDRQKYTYYEAFLDQLQQEMLIEQSQAVSRASLKDDCRCS